MKNTSEPKPKPSTDALALAKLIINLNPTCREIGAGYMAEMKALAERIVKNEL